MKQTSIIAELEEILTDNSWNIDDIEYNEDTDCYKVVAMKKGSKTRKIDVPREDLDNLLNKLEDEK
jgi:predicted transcriptional regulator